MTRGRSAGAGLAAVVLVLAGCGGLSQEEKRAGVDLGWRMTVEAADDALGRLPEVFPDVEFVPFVEDPAETRKSDCSSSSAGSATNPTAIQWASQRDVEVQPSRETATLADGLAAALAADGWEAEDPEINGEVHRVRLHREGISVWLLADTAVRVDGTATIRILAYSPCLQAPENMGDWTPPTDAPTPSVAGSTS